MSRIDTHHHLIPPDYRTALAAAGLADTGAGELPACNLETTAMAMDNLAVSTAILSAPTPGTAFLPDADGALAMARRLNDYSAEVVAGDPHRFGFFATVPLPHVREAVTETVQALDELHADGVMLLGNSAGSYLGSRGQQELFAALNARAAVVFVHPAELPGPTVAGMPPFAADFLLDTTRAAYLLVRNGVRREYPDIRFVLSHAGGFVPYASHRLAISIAGDTGWPMDEILAEFAGFYFDTALSSSPSALPSLLAFAGPGQVVFGSDCPFAAKAVGGYFATGLDEYPGLDGEQRRSIDRTNAEALFPRLRSTASS